MNIQKDGQDSYWFTEDDGEIIVSVNGEFMGSFVKKGLKPLPSRNAGARSVHAINRAIVIWNGKT